MEGIDLLMRVVCSGDGDVASKENTFAQGMFHEALVHKQVLQSDTPDR